MLKLDQMADAALDRIAAEEVMGWNQPVTCGAYFGWSDSKGEAVLLDEGLWGPTTCLNDAWRLVEKVGGDGEVIISKTTHGCSVRLDIVLSEWAEAATPVSALTIAAIKAVRSKNDG